MGFGLGRGAQVLGLALSPVARKQPDRTRPTVRFDPVEGSATELGNLRDTVGGDRCGDIDHPPSSPAEG